MANNFVTEEQIKLYKGFVKGIREDLGRNVILHIPGPPKKCPNCLWDPVNRRSTGMFSPLSPFPTVTDHNGNSITGAQEFRGGICPVCNATGQTTTETTKVVQCGIRYLKSDHKRYIIQGIEAQNDFRLKADIKFESDFNAARIIEVDGIPTEMTVLNRGGLRDLIQIIVFCKRSEWPPGFKKDVSRF